jgi:hypothetical protein
MRGLLADDDAVTRQRSGHPDAELSRGVCPDRPERARKDVER